MGFTDLVSDAGLTSKFPSNHIREVLQRHALPLHQDKAKIIRAHS